MIAVLHRLDSWAKHMAPLAIAVALLLVGLLRGPIPNWSMIGPAWLLICVFHWSYYRPDLMPVGAAFALGLAQDLLSGGPLGANALILAVLRAAVPAQRRFPAERSFVGLWWMFMAAAGAASVALWLLMCVLREALIDPTPALFQLVVTVAVYPPVAWVFIRLQRWLSTHAEWRP